MPDGGTQVIEGWSGNIEQAPGGISDGGSAFIEGQGGISEGWGGD